MDTERELIKQLLFTSFLLPTFCCCKMSLASDYSGMSASPDYSYDSYSNRDSYSNTYNVNDRTMTPSYRKPANDSTKTFSSNVYISRPNSQSGFRPQPVSKSSTYNTQYSSQSAYYKTRPYKY